MKRKGVKKPAVDHSGTLSLIADALQKLRRDLEMQRDDLLVSVRDVAHSTIKNEKNKDTGWVAADKLRRSEIDGLDGKIERLGSIVETRLQKLERDMLDFRRDTDKARACAIGERVHEGIEYLVSVGAAKSGRFLVLGTNGRPHAYITVELDTTGLPGQIKPETKP